MLLNFTKHFCRYPASHRQDLARFLLVLVLKITFDQENSYNSTHIEELSNPPVDSFCGEQFVAAHKAGKC